MIRRALRALGILPPERPVRPTAAEPSRIPRSHVVGELTVPIPAGIPPGLRRSDDDRRRDVLRNTTHGVRHATAALRELQAYIDGAATPEAAHVREVAAYHQIDAALRALRAALPAPDETTGDTPS